MTAGAKARRKLRHAAEKAAREAVKTAVAGTLPVIPDFRPLPHLTFVSMKTHRHNNPRKNMSGHRDEHSVALKDHIEFLQAEIERTQMGVDSGILH